MSVSIQALVSGSPAGDPVYALCPEPADHDRAGVLDDLPGLAAAYYSEPLPLPPRVHLPPGELGVIRWPCWGLSRFAVGHLLVRAADVLALEAVSGWDGSVRVTLADGSTDPATTVDMVVAATRPLADPRAEAAADLTDAEALAVVTLADARWANAGRLYGTTSGTASTWGDLINSLVTAAGFTSPSASSINTTLSAHSPAYPVPPSGRWANSLLAGRPAVVLADAACAAVSLRIAVDGDGTVTVQGPAAAESEWDDWWADYGSRMGSGGLVEGDRELPEDVRCSFGTATVTESVTGGVRGSVSVELADSASNANWAARYADDLERWLAVPWPAGTGWGYPGVPGSGVPFLVSFHTAGGWFSLDRSPVGYPWPLCGGGGTSSAGGTVTIDTRNVDGTEVGVTDDMRFDQSTGVKIAQGGSFDTVSLLLATTTQRGTMGVTGDGPNGLQKMSGRKLFEGNTLGVTSDTGAVDQSGGTPLGLVYADSGLTNFAAGVFALYVGGVSRSDVVSHDTVPSPPAAVDYARARSQSEVSVFGGYAFHESLYSLTSGPDEYSCSVYARSNGQYGISFVGGAPSSPDGIYVDESLTSDIRVNRNLIADSGSAFGARRSGTDHTGIDDEITACETFTVKGGVVVSANALTSGTPVATDRIQFCSGGTPYYCTMEELKTLLDSISVSPPPPP